MCSFIGSVSNIRLQIKKHPQFFFSVKEIEKKMQTMHMTLTRPSTKSRDGTEEFRPRVQCMQQLLEFLNPHIEKRLTQSSVARVGVDVSVQLFHCILIVYRVCKI